ncbi:MAG: tetratricopeptide repeat protein, partial [Candidatus Kariarchaeaceae archaeon]
FYKIIEEVTDSIANGQLNSALEEINQIEKETDNQEILMNAIYYKGKINLINCNYEKAFNLAEHSFHLAKTLKRFDFVAKALALQGFAATHMGKLDESFAIMEKSEKFLEQCVDDTIEFDRNLINTAGNINNVKGISYWKKGDLSNALKCHKNALEYRRQLPKKLEVAITYSNIATVYRDMGDSKNALKYYEKAYSITKTLDNKRTISRVLFYIIQTALIFDHQDKVEQYEPHLAQLQDHKNPFIQLNYKITKALILKGNKRLRQKMESEKIFYEIIESPIHNPHLTLLAMKHLWEIYLDEYKLYGEEEVLKEITTLTDRMKVIAEDIGISSHYIEALVLQAKLAELDGSYNEATKLLEEAENIAAKRGLVTIENDIIKEKFELSRSYSKWKGIIDSSTSVAEKMDMLKLKQYIIHAQKVAGIKFNE